MFEPLRLAQIDPERIFGRFPSAKTRNLGAEILAMAVEDYRAGDCDEYESARRFLYPCTGHEREHFEWAVSMVSSVDPAWLRQSLDRMRPQWDAQRRVQ